MKMLLISVLLIVSTSIVAATPLGPVDMCMLGISKMQRACFADSSISGSIANSSACCVSLIPPSSGACSDTWERAFRLHAVRERPFAGDDCAVRRECPFNPVPVETPCFASACESMWASGASLNESPGCASAISTYCTLFGNVDPACSSWTSSAATTIDEYVAQTHTTPVDDVDRFQRAAHDFSVETVSTSLVSRETFEWLFVFGCTTYANSQRVECPCVVFLYDEYDDDGLLLGQPCANNVHADMRIVISPTNITGISLNGIVILLFLFVGIVGASSSSSSSSSSYSLSTSNLSSVWDHVENADGDADETV